MYDQDEQNGVSHFGNSFTDMVWKGNRKWFLITFIILIIAGVVGFIIYKRKHGFGKRR
jgi:hypothetical protein